MTTDPPRLTDRTSLLARRARARTAQPPALFLQTAMADDVQERLKEVNRPFTDIAIVTGWPEIWAPRFPDALIIPDEDSLALSSGAHDLVIHALALHWAPDIVGQLVQCRRALRPDGLLIATLFGGQTLQELRAALAQAEIAVTGGLSPRIAPMAEIRDLGGLLQRAGLALPVADATPLTVTYASALHLMHDLRAMGETNALSGRIRHFSRREIFTKMQELYQHSYGGDSDRLPATFEVITLTGWAPSDTQPQPLRPGSAQTRLADALGTREFDPNQSKD